MTEPRQINGQNYIERARNTAKGGGGVPANAITLRNSSLLTLRDGSNITIRSAA